MQKWNGFERFDWVNKGLSQREGLIVLRLLAEVWDTRRSLRLADFVDALKR